MLCERLLNVDGPSSLEIVLVTRVNSTNFQSLPRIHIGERLRGYDETFTKNIDQNLRCNSTKKIKEIQLKIINIKMLTISKQIAKICNIRATTP